MANPMNVLPQVNSTRAPTVNARHPSKGEVALKGDKKNLNEAPASEFEATLNEGIQDSEKKAALEKEAVQAAALMQAGAAKVLTPVVQKLPTEAGEEKADLKGDVKETAKGSSKITSLKVTSSNPKEDVLTALTEKVAGTAKVAETPSQTINFAALNGLKMGTPQTQAQVKAQAQAQTAALAQVAKSDANEEQDFEVESLDVKSADLLGAKFGIQKSEVAAQPPGTPASKLSTADYLNLRDVSKKDSISANSNLGDGKGQFDLGTFGKADPKKGKLAQVDARETVGATALSQTFQLNSHSKVIEGPTTQGTAGKTILAHDTIHQMTEQVNLMSVAKQDGEIKIRLRPDHLGELQMSVKTQGQNVAIQIKAQSGESKKIIEDSINSLRRSLSEQNLTLSSVDVVTQAPKAQSEQGLQMDLSGQRQNFGQDSSSSQFSDQQQTARQERLYEESLNPRNINTARSANASRINRNGADGLDMIA